jgi:hypothetical protein
MNLSNPAETINSILTLYDSKLPFSVAEYFCKVFHPFIVCNQPLKYKLFEDFIDYKDDVNYVFTKVIQTDRLSKEQYVFVKLDSIVVNIPNGREDDFMDRYSNYIFASSSDSGIEWLNEAEIETNKYIGKCKISF